jgi:AdoMet-dependent rRNA methyltransferase SPB1
LHNNRNRTGYESGLSLIYKVKSAAEFILAEKPTEMLSQFSKLSLVGEDALVQPSAKPTEGDGEGSDGEDDEEDAELGPSVNLNEHPATTQEIRALVEDLRVLGKKEFKLLMKWCVSPPRLATLCR